jgi:TolA-binding protein
MTELRCVDVEGRLVDVIDGRLDPAESVRFHSHIEGCAACRERAALWRGLVPGMRGAVAPGPDAMATRRMALAIQRRLAGAAAPAPARRWRAWWAPAFGAVAVAAVVAIWLRAAGPERAGAVGYAMVASVRGGASLGNGAAAAAARVPIGAPIALLGGAAIDLALDGGAALRAEGPARLALEGSADHVAVRLTEGTVRAEVTHRQPRETFVVLTGDVRVEVRGTKFLVVAGRAGSRVEVSEGQVAVQRADGRTTLVSAGGSFDTTQAALGKDDEAPADSPEAPIAADRSTTCAEVARTCQATARAVRTSMRGNDPERALRMIADARRAGRGGEAACPRGAGACDDELRYLHAEALNQSGRLDDAVAAYRALDRRAAPPAMRQNALYAAAQIQRRQGRLTAATADFERALAAAPRGALHEDALVGAMESARAGGDGARARALAARYLEEFPRGLAAATARMLAGDGAP